ncbi:MAG: ice-binding family protein [Bryobacteraceae bacterium]
MKAFVFSAVVLVVSALSLLPVSARAGTISLGTAAPYAVIAETLVSNPTTFGDTVITGGVAVSPSGACTGFMPAACGGASAGTISGAIHINDTPAADALADAGTAELALLATVIPAPVDLTGHVLGSPGYTSLAPGIYTFTSSAQLTGTLTLAAGADLDPVWIFEIATTLTTATDASVNVTDTTGGAGIAGAGVYWVEETGQAILGNNTAFLGNIFAGTNITFYPGAQDTCGRAFADTSVTFGGDNPAQQGGQPNIVSDTCAQSASGFNGPTPGAGGGTPEPGTLVLLSSGLLAMVLLAFRKSRVSPLI